MKSLIDKRDWSVWILLVLLSWACFDSGVWTSFDIRAAQAKSGEADRQVYDGYREYQERLYAVEERGDISENGFVTVENQIFALEMKAYGTIWMIPAFDAAYQRLALFFADESGKIVYRTEQLEVNHRIKGKLKQPGKDVAAVSFRDLNHDGALDIILIVSCVNAGGEYAGTPYKIGDVLFADGVGGFYRDYRISDKINRFGMNQSTEVITACVRDARSTEFLYTATTLKELLRQGFTVSKGQSYERTFEKLGKLRVVPGIYRISNYDIFMIYLINEQGSIVSCLQPMGDYESLYALRGINCRDIDGDGLKDIAILARYNYEDENGESLTVSDYAIYYQRVGGFVADTYVKDSYRCGDEDSMETLIERARACWGWKAEE